MNILDFPDLILGKILLDFPENLHSLIQVNKQLHNFIRAHPELWRYDKFYELDQGKIQIIDRAIHLPPVCNASDKADTIFRWIYPAPPMDGNEYILPPDLVIHPVALRELRCAISSQWTPTPIEGPVDRLEIQLPSNRDEAIALLDPKADFFDPIEGFILRRVVIFSKIIRMIGRLSDLDPEQIQNIIQISCAIGAVEPLEILRRQGHDFSLEENHFQNVVENGLTHLIEFFIHSGINPNQKRNHY